MPRRRVVAKRETIPDPIFKSKLVTKCVNVIMKQGKKSTAERIFYDAMDVVAKKTNEEPLKVFTKAVDNVKPVVEVKSRRVGGSTYQVPVDVRQERRIALALRWLTGYARSRSEKTMAEKFAGEVVDAFRSVGNAVKKREDTHKMAEANKAFAHYRW
jgi:small subunit ribosomal protein S7